MIRQGGSALAAIAALAWLSERLSGTDNRPGRMLDMVLGHAPWAVRALTPLAFTLRHHARHETVTSTS